MFTILRNLFEQSSNIIKVTADLISLFAAITTNPFYVKIDNLRDTQHQGLLSGIKYPEQNSHLVVPMLRDLKCVVIKLIKTGDLYLNL